MNIIAFIFYAGLFCIFAGINTAGLPIELIVALCALVLAVKSI